MNLIVQEFISWITFIPNIVAIILIVTIGETIKTLILGKDKINSNKKLKKWKYIYYVTYKMQSLFIGALLGLIPNIPTPEAFQEGVTGAILNYSGIGAISMVVYPVIIGNIKSYVKQKNMVGD